MRTRVKICGITCLEDGLAAAGCGADAVGLVFHAPSARAVDTQAAASIGAGLPPFVSVVALFVNPTAVAVHQVLGAMHVDLLQFHGDEDPVFCEQFAVPYVKAVRVRAAGDVAAVARIHTRAAGLLLDAHRPGLWGGTGETFDWTLVPGETGMPVILAGGLGPDNVAAAIRAVRPHAVDVSGGVERAPGRKDSRLIEAFIAEVNRVEAR